MLKNPFCKYRFKIYLESFLSVWETTEKGAQGHTDPYYHTIIKLIHIE